MNFLQVKYAASFLIMPYLLSFSKYMHVPYIFYDAFKHANIHLRIVNNESKIHQLYFFKQT